MKEALGYCRVLDEIGEHERSDFIFSCITAQTVQKKHVIIFDFDETLALTECKIRLQKSDGTKMVLTPAEFAVYERQHDDVFDFDDFEHCINAKPIERNIEKAIRHHMNHGEDGLLILTARPQAAAPAILDFLARHNLPPIGVIGLNSGAPEAKANVIKQLIKSQNIEHLEFIDDSYKNIAAVDVLKDDPEFENVVIETEHFQVDNYQ
jgi:hypothetical protein